MSGHAEHGGGGGSGLESAINTFAKDLPEQMEKGAEPIANASADTTLFIFTIFCLVLNIDTSGPSHGHG